MKTSILKLITAALLLTVGVSVIGLAQRNRLTTGTKAAPTLLSALPPSDAVAIINVTRVINEALLQTPRRESGEVSRSHKRVGQV